VAGRETDNTGWLLWTLPTPPLVCVSWVPEPQHLSLSVHRSHTAPQSPCPFPHWPHYPHHTNAPSPPTCRRIPCCYHQYHLAPSILPGAGGYTMPAILRFGMPLARYRLYLLYRAAHFAHCPAYRAGASARRGNHLRACYHLGSKTGATRGITPYRAGCARGLPGDDVRGRVDVGWG